MTFKGKAAGKLVDMVGRPVLWAYLGGLSRYIARALPPRPPATLVVSLPRSGSSWVGKMLGLSATALYLREPITQTYLRRFGYSHPSVFAIDPANPPPSYKAYADGAFAGVPAFRRQIVANPKQWSLRARRRRRLVVKEVNPLALEWLVRTYRPKVVYLIRHPAAVANSYAELGWLGSQSASRLDERLTEEQRAVAAAARSLVAPSPWAEFGLFQALTTKIVAEVLKGYGDHTVLKYEDLCADPLGAFRELYDFAGLAWDERVASGVRSHSDVREHDRAKRYSTFRNSRAMADAWRSDIRIDLAAEVRRGYLAGDPSFYGPDEW